MATEMQNVQTAAALASQTKGLAGKLGLDVLGKPPMCHVYVNAVAAFFVPPLGHYLARPGDIKSKSFTGVFAIWLASWVLSLIPIVGSIISFVTGPVIFVVTVYSIFVVFWSEKRNPRDPALMANAEPGVLSIERGGA